MVNFSKRNTGKIKKFLDCYIPVTTCNLRCSYCYIAQQGLFKAEVPQFEHSPEEIRRALSRKRLGGACLINLCGGGETLIPKEVVKIVKELLDEGHYVMIVSNGLLKERFQELAKLKEDYKEKLFIKFSFHFLELKQRNLFSVFFENVNIIKNAGIAMSVELTPCDEEISYIEDIKAVCRANLNGVLCHVTIGRSDVDPESKIPHLSQYPFDEYVKIWETFDSPLFDFKKNIFYHKRREFCYAGEWTAYINLGTGEMKQCYCGKVLDNIFENVNEKLNFEAIGKKCELAHCYNGHVWLPFGNIPKLKVPTYAELRNRICEDESEWLQPEIKEVFSTNLLESNKPYSFIKKIKVNYFSKR